MAGAAQSLVRGSDNRGSHVSHDTDQIVITGAGLITCLGLTRQATWQAVRHGGCGMGPLSALEQPIPQGHSGGQAPPLPEDFAPDQPREVRYLKRAILDALADAKLDQTRPYPAERCGVMLGTTLHGMRSAGQFFRTGDYDAIGRFLAANVLADATGGLGWEGFAATTCSACSSGLGSIALAMTLLQTGELDVVIAGGYDAISEYVYAGFNSLRLVTSGPLRPFAKQRQGMKLAEGYGLVVLERAADARRRGANMIGEILGMGESSDAHHLTQPHPQGEGAARAMRAAMQSAGLIVGQIDLIVAHATGTPDNDAAEYAALRHIFGGDLPRVPVVGFKSHLGHTLGAAGVAELILAAMALSEQVVPPCANVQAEEGEFADLNLATGAPRAAALRAAMSTSLGFGGANAAAVIGPPAAVVNPAAPGAIRKNGRREVVISGIGVVLPGMIGNQAFADRIRRPLPVALLEDSGAIADGDFVHLLNARRIRRMADYVKLSLAATTLACQDAKLTDLSSSDNSWSALFGTMHCAAGYSENYYAQVVREGMAAANPMLFAEGVPNCASAHTSLMLSLKGCCQTLLGTRTAGLDALRLAMLRIAGGQWEHAIVGVAEEYSPLVNAAYGHCGVYVGREPSAPFGNERGFSVGAGAVTFILETRRAVEERGGRVYGSINAAASTATARRADIPAMAQMLAKLGPVDAILTSANGTWIDRAEAAAIKRAMASAAPTAPAPVISSMCGHIAEIFSVTALAGIAAVLLNGYLPALLAGSPENIAPLRPADGRESLAAFTALCTGFTGTATALRITPTLHGHSV